MFEWRQEPCQFRDITDKVSLPEVTRNQTKPLRLKRKHTRKNRHASGLNENGSIWPIRGCAAGWGMVFGLSVLNRVYSFIRLCPKLDLNLSQINRARSSLNMACTVPYLIELAPSLE